MLSTSKKVGTFMAVLLAVILLLYWLFAETLFTSYSPASVSEPESYIQEI